MKNNQTHSPLWDKVRLTAIVAFVLMVIAAVFVTNYENMKASTSTISDNTCNLTALPGTIRKGGTSTLHASLTAGYLGSITADGSVVDPAVSDKDPRTSVSPKKLTNYVLTARSPNGGTCTARETVYIDDSQTDNTIGTTPVCDISTQTKKGKFRVNYSIKPRSDQTIENPKSIESFNLKTNEAVIIQTMDKNKGKTKWIKNPKDDTNYSVRFGYKVGNESYYMTCSVMVKGS